MQREQNAGYWHAKQACYLCHQPHDVVDTEIQIEGEGALCICRGCIGTLALTAGYTVDNDRTQEIAALRVELAEAEKERDISDRIIAELAAEGNNAKRRAKARLAKVTTSA